MERDDNASAECFLRFAALDDETLELFRKAVGELRVNGTFTWEIQTPIPEAEIDLFASFAEVFTGLEASMVKTILGRGKLPDPSEDLAEADKAPDDELEVLWHRVLAQLQTQMPQGTFDTWLKDTRLVAREGLQFTVAVQNGFAREWLENRLYGIIQRTLAGQVTDRDDQALSRVEIDFWVED